MGNILVFLSKYYKFFLFVFLEVICLFLVVNYNRDQQSTFFAWTYEMSGRANQAYSDVTAYFSLRQVNDSLMAENARLRAMQPNARLLDTSRPINIVDTMYKQRYTYVPARVVNNSTNVKNNYLTLDAGSLKGITGHLGVVSTAGIVGRTRFISDNFSTALSVLHKDFTVNAMISENQEAGMVVWDGRDPNIVIMKDVPMHVKLEKGMHVVVSHTSDAFPTGTPIGTIVRFEQRGGDPFFTIYVRLAADIRNLKSVYIVRNHQKQEQDSLEQTTRSAEEE